MRYLYLGNKSFTMGTRRNFIGQLVGSALAVKGSEIVYNLISLGLENELTRIASSNPWESARDEEFWAYIRNEYINSPTIINLNNGGVSPQPKAVVEAINQYNRVCAEGPSYFMWRILDKGRESLRSKLADLAGSDAEEISICRNSTEALDTIIFGLRLNEGDEIVLSRYDYPNMMNAWRQREKRDGIKLVWIDLPMPAESDDEIVEIYKKAFSTRTRIVHITHMINWTGQVLPAKRIAEAARQIGAEVIIDGAHTFAHIDYNIPDLGGDYYGTSLHKWLCAPLGTGMLWVKKEKIPQL